MALFLGLDASTQSLSAMVIDSVSGRIIRDEHVNFGAELAQYRSPHGFLEDPDPAVRHSDPLMWVEALERVLGKLKAAGLDLSQIAGVSGAGQQHGSVYLRTPISEAAPWSPNGPLRDQIEPLLSRRTSPIWMDSSTRVQCAEIAAAVGGDATVVAISGSRAIERFTAPQIRKFYAQEPEAYQATREIQLVSSFMASVLIGSSAAIDLGDGAGMNLLDLGRGAWSTRLLEATAPELASKLQPAIPSTTKVGEMAPYFVKKYGFARATPVIAFTGDNPSSLVGMGAAQAGTFVISLGTSDTVFAAMQKPHTDPHGFGNVFGNPAGGFMCLICFANGSLAREAVAQRVGLSWTEFERAILVETKAGNAGNWMLPYFVPEMTPKIQNPKVELMGSDAFVAYRDPQAAARAIVEAQALSMLRHSDWIGEQPSVVRVTGGASRNRGILQVIADVLGAEVCSLATGNASALGAALRAAQAVEGRSWSELFTRFAAPDPNFQIRPTAGVAAVYAALAARFSERLRALGWY